MKLSAEEETKRLSQVPLEVFQEEEDVPKTVPKRVKALHSATLPYLNRAKLVVNAPQRRSCIFLLFYFVPFALITALLSGLWCFREHGLWTIAQPYRFEVNVEYFFSNNVKAAMLRRLSRTFPCISPSKFAYRSKKGGA